MNIGDEIYPDLQIYLSFRTISSTANILKRSLDG